MKTVTSTLAVGALVATVGVVLFERAVTPALGLTTRDLIDGRK